MNQSPLDHYQNLARAAVRRNKLYLLDKIELRYLTQYIDSRFPDPMGFRAVRLLRTEQGVRVLQWHSVKPSSQPHAQKHSTVFSV